MTHLITAAAFEHDNIVLYFLQSGYSLNDTCKEMKKIRLINDNNEHFYVKGLSFWHMLAIYASEIIMEFVIKQRQFDYAWNIIDEYGATPVHYTCCSAALDELKYFEYFDALAPYMLNRAFNGSTPAPSAALCGLDVPIIIFVTRQKHPMNIKDNSNKNFLLIKL